MLNQVTISGRLGRDPETRAVGNGKVTNFSVCVSEKYKDKNGEMQEKSSWVRINAWGKTGEIAADARKGDAVIICGALESRNWEDKDGNKRESLEVNARMVFHVAKMEGSKSTTGKTQNNKQPDFNDEIPF